MLFKPGELRLLWPFYLYYLIFGLTIMIMPFLVLYFQELGFSFVQIAAIVGAFGIASVLFEVPTGAFADSISRKYSVILGFSITGIAVLLIPFFTQFWALIALWTIAGIGMTFVSGAEQAWVVDNLGFHKRLDLQQEYFMKSQILAAAGAVFAPFAGALLVKYWALASLWYIFGIGFALNAVLLALFGQELIKPKRASLIAALADTWSNGRKGLQFVQHHSTVLLLIIGAIFIQMMTIGDNGWQPFMVDLGIQQHQLGYVYSAAAAFGMLMIVLSRYLANWKPQHAMTFIIGLRMIVLLSVWFIYPPLYLAAAAIFVIDAALFNMKNPILQNYLHKFIPQEIRATVVSVQSMYLSIAFSLAALAAGFLLDAVGPQPVLAFGSLFGIIAILIFLKIKD